MSHKKEKSRTREFKNRDVYIRNTEFDLEIQINAGGGISVNDYTTISEMMCTEVMRGRGKQYNCKSKKEPLKTKPLCLPTESEMNATRLEINSLNALEPTLEPTIRNEFHKKIKSAENQLRIIRAEMANPNLNIYPKSVQLKISLSHHWDQLNMQLIEAENLCG